MDIELLQLTEIGEFGLVRKPRPTVPEHLHTGIDIKRPKSDYQNPVYIFPTAPGRIISKREDGPYAQLIIEHKLGALKFWSVYEHIAGIAVEVDQFVDPYEPIARFYFQNELDTYGWQFDHFHFEILKSNPIKITPSPKLPDRRFASYTLSCKSEEDLDRHFYDPITFLIKFSN